MKSILATIQKLEARLAAIEPARASFIIIYKGKKVLVGRRWHDGSYTFPGGRFDEGEDKYDAAMRELEEETGISLEKKDLKFLGSELIKDGKKKIYVFEAEYNGEDPEVEHKKEIYKWKWIKKKDLYDYIDPEEARAHDKYILDHID